MQPFQDEDLRRLNEASFGSDPAAQKTNSDVALAILSRWKFTTSEMIAVATLLQERAASIELLAARMYPKSSTRVVAANALVEADIRRVQDVLHPAGIFIESLEGTGFFVSETCKNIARRLLFGSIPGGESQS